MHSFEKGKLNDFEIRETENNYQQSADNIYCGFVFFEKCAERSGEQSQQAEYDGEAEHKTECPEKHLVLFVRAACKIRNVKRQERKHAGRDEGYKAFKKSNDKFHIRLLCCQSKMDSR